MRFARFLVATGPLLVLMGSCVGPAPRPPAGISAPTPGPARPSPAPAPPPASAAPASVEWQYRPTTPGDWIYRADAAGSSASFGILGSAPPFAIRCDRSGKRISFARAGAAPGPMIVRTNYGSLSWPATPGAGALPELVATRAASDTALDQIAYSRGRFAIEVAGAQTLILPAWAEVSRVVEDCRG